MMNAETELARLAAAAELQGRKQIVGVCRLALAQIAALEQEIQQLRQKAGAGGRQRLHSLTPAQRSLIASKAAKRRWGGADAYG